MRNFKTIIIITLAAALAIGGGIPLPAQTNGGASTNGDAFVSPRRGPSVVERKDFVFKGGNLHDFLNQLKSEFGIDVQERAHIPDSDLWQTQVPDIRATFEIRGNRNPAWQILKLYNEISTKYPSMGNWVIVDSATTGLGATGGGPNSVLFVPPGAETKNQFAVRAFEVGGLGKVDELLGLINGERDQLEMEALRRHYSPQDMDGSVHITQGDSAILVAIGGKAYIEMVASLVDAYKSQHRFDILGAHAGDTNSPAK